MIMKFIENTKRSVIKAITFRLIILVADSVVILLVTHRYDVTLAVVLISNFSSTVLYLLHERVWNHVMWGKAVQRNGGLAAPQALSQDKM